MNSNKLVSKLAAARAKLAKLEAEAERMRSRELALLPQKLGFSDVGALIKALKRLANSKPKAGAATPAGDKPSTKKRKRGKVTDETRRELRKMVEAGKTGLEIAKALKISQPTVQNIKKALGLVRTSKSAGAPQGKKPSLKGPGIKSTK